MKNNNAYAFNNSCPYDPSRLDSIHINCEVMQEKKYNQNVCGDYYLIHRTAKQTIFILTDGIGSGIKANIAAIMCANRLLTLMQSGISLIESCEKVVAMMHKARTTNVPFAAFTIAKILNNGNYTILSYESPAPILIEGTDAQQLKQRFFTLSKEVVSEVTGLLKPNQSIALVSDGVTQAGLGIIKGLGWGTEGLLKYLNNKLKTSQDPKEIMQGTLNRVYELSQNIHRDDISMALLTCNHAKVLNILTGPATYKRDDKKLIDAFINNGGHKIVCGSTTAEIVSRVLNKPVEVVKISPAFDQPPQYDIEGVDIVTEGAVTLNQVYNILEESEDTYNKESCVSVIAELMKEADIIKFYIGGAVNPGHKEITFKQLGVLPRKTIVNLLVNKLKKMGKTVTEYYK